MIRQRPLHSPPHPTDPHRFFDVLSQGITAYFYLRTCWTILVRFKARERVKRRHQGIVRKFVAIMTIVIVTNALWTTYLYMCVPFVAVVPPRLPYGNT